MIMFSKCSVLLVTKEGNGLFLVNRYVGKSASVGCISGVKLEGFFVSFCSISHLSPVGGGNASLR